MTFSTSLAKTGKRKKVRLIQHPTLQIQEKTDFPTVSYFTHKIITHYSFFCRPFLKQGQTIQCTSLRQKPNYPTHIFPLVTQYMNYNPFYNLALVFYLISNNTFMMDCGTIFDIIFSWWTTQLLRHL